MAKLSLAFAWQPAQGQWPSAMLIAAYRAVVLFILFWPSFAPLCGTRLIRIVTYKIK